MTQRDGMGREEGGGFRMGLNLLVRKQNFREVKYLNCPKATL